MRLQNSLRAAVLVIVTLALAGGAVPAAAQSRVTTSDIQSLEQQLDDATYEISRVRRTDSSRASRLSADLDLLREEVIYLKVKLRKDGSVTTREYNDTRDRIGDLIADARGRSTGGSTGTGTSGRSTDYPTGTTYPERRSTEPNTIPIDTELDVRLLTPLSSDTAQPEDRFEATTEVDLYEGDRVLVPAGSTLRGVVTSVERATRTDRTGRLTLAFDQITINGRDYPIRATVTQALESGGLKDEAVKIGTGGAIGAIIGGILGGAKGALIGVLVGAGGTVAATEGKNVKLDAGTILRIRLDQPLRVRK